MEFKVENSAPLRQDSTEPVLVTVTADQLLNQAAPVVGFTADRAGSPQMLFQASWVNTAGFTRLCALPVGPGTAVGVLTAGRLFIVAGYSAAQGTFRGAAGQILVTAAPAPAAVAAPVFGLTPDPNHPGLLLLSGGNLTPDPDHPGLLILGS